MKHSALLTLLGQCRDALVDHNHSEDDEGALIRAVDEALDSRQPARVWVLTFDLDNSGISSQVFASKETALAEVYSHVAEYWAEEMSDPMPENSAQAIDEYFNRDDPDDSYVLQACEVQD